VLLAHFPLLLSWTASFFCLVFSEQELDGAKLIEVEVQLIEHLFNYTYSQTESALVYILDQIENNVIKYVHRKKKYFQDLLSQHFFFCQINLNNLFSSDNLLFW